MVYESGDRVYVIIADQRIDGSIAYIKYWGTVIESFNAWCPKDGDRWQYRIKGDTGQYLVFYDGIDKEVQLLSEKE